jgi:peptidyl-dipeptidase A
VGLRGGHPTVTAKDQHTRPKAAAETKLELALADPEAFAELKAIKESGVQDRLLARQIDVLYLQYLPRQVDPQLLKRMLEKSNAIEQAFNTYRPKVDGQELSDSQVRKVLRESTDSAQRRKTWEASKGVAPRVAPGLADLVKLRNEAARKLGFKNYHAMQLSLGEQSQEQVLALFDQLEALTREPFRAAKAEFDAVLAKNCGVTVAELRPWHYHDPFFQEPPEVFPNLAEEAFAKADILRVAREFYAGIGLPVDDILRRSDLYEKPGKNPHAFCTDIDRAGDVRVLANIVPNRYWLSTMIHELGHGVYSSKNIPASVPYVLRTDAHALATEGIAMMFERFVDNADWLGQLGVSVPNPAAYNTSAAKLRRNRLLVFSRWCQVMLRFEVALYDNPEQDLNRLWWDLVEKYQEVRRPEGRNAPDYAAKIHIVQAPAYYHNYMMGELFASQVHHALVREALGGGDPLRAIYVGNPAAGAFLKKRVFAPGRSLNWSQLTRHATGEELNAKAFAADLGGKPNP